MANFNFPNNMQEFSNPMQSFMMNPNVNNTIVEVNGFESAKQFQTKPNSIYALFDSNEDLVYIKQTDSSNYPMYKTFQLVEVIDEPQVSGQYVSMDEFLKLKEELNNVKQYIRKPKNNPKRRNSKWDGNSTEQRSDDNSGCSSDS